MLHPTPIQWLFGNFSNQNKDTLTNIHSEPLQPFKGIWGMQLFVKINLVQAVSHVTHQRPLVNISVTTQDITQLLTCVH